MRTKQQIQAEIKSLEATIKGHDPQYGPENYYCDGELSKAEADARWKGWHDKLDELQKELG